MEQIIAYFSADPLNLLYIVGGSGGLWFWVKEWRSRTRVRISFLSETFDSVGDQNLNVKIELEITNLGESITSVEQSVKVKALTPERKNVTYEFKVETQDRSLKPHIPKQIALSAVCNQGYHFTWYRSYSIKLSRGRNGKFRTRNIKNSILNPVEYIVGNFCFRIFKWVPKDA
ncbi:MAG: hypothetical protein ACI9FB_002076 [Candidatus Azotimanducaceae bacterium]|jgi:hypothetical protein